jgi:FRG domain
MADNSFEFELQPTPGPFKERIEKWHGLESKYHDAIRGKIDQFIASSTDRLKKKMISSTINACTDGLFIEREATKYNPDTISIYGYSYGAEQLRAERNLGRLEHVQFSNKARFYSLDYFPYDYVEKYDPLVEAEEDFSCIVSNDGLLDDAYIRSVEDAIELGVNSNFEKGQFIFRGQVNHEWELVPRLFREYPKDAHTIEIALCESLLLGAKNPYMNTYDPIELLMNLQHFGIPTRLLDWTSDILIALFFACYDDTEKHDDKDGNLYIVERAQYAPLKVNSSANNPLREPITAETTELFKTRLDIDDIRVFEPVVKSPRLRVQDGCFMMFSFFPLDAGNPKYVTLHEFMRAKNKSFESDNKGQDVSQLKIWIGNKRVDKDYKKAILAELEEKHGISKQSIFVEIPHVERVANYYQMLYQKAKAKGEWIISQRKK